MAFHDNLSLSGGVPTHVVAHSIYGFAGRMVRDYLAKKLLKEAGL